VPSGRLDSSVGRYAFVLGLIRLLRYGGREGRKVVTGCDVRWRRHLGVGRRNEFDSYFGNLRLRGKGDGGRKFKSSSHICDFVRVN
jgi:hypothetical protein